MVDAMEPVINVMSLYQGGHRKLLKLKMLYTFAEASPGTNMDDQHGEPVIFIMPP